MTQLMLIIAICLTLAAITSHLWLDAYDKEYDNKDK